MAFSIRGVTPPHAFTAGALNADFSSTIGDLISKVIEAIRNFFAQVFCCCFKSASAEPGEETVDSKPEKVNPLFNKGKKFISKNGDAILSKATGIKTEHAASAGSYFAGSFDALQRGKYQLAGTAAMAGLSAGLLAVTNLVLPKEVRELNKVYTN